MLSESAVNELGNALVELTSKVSARTRSHAEIRAAVRSLGAGDLAAVARHLAHAERIVLYDAELDLAYGVLRREARARGVRPASSPQGLRFEELARTLEAPHGARFATSTR